MSQTDSTYAMTTRPSALGDLRFAGTIATGLVAGTLGLGALAAPLVGWKDWPQALERDAATQPLRLATPKQAEPRGTQPNGGPEGQTPGGATPLTTVGVPGGGAGGTVPALPAFGIGGSPATPDSSTTSARGDRTGTASEGTGSGQFSGPQFAPVDDRDNDADGIPNDYERMLNANPDDAGDATVRNSSGISNSTEFRIRSASLPLADSNGDGVIDGTDDSDGDGVSNAAEERNGSDPTLADSNGDGTPDGMDDRDGDGYPDGLPVRRRRAAGRAAAPGRAARRRRAPGAPGRDRARRDPRASGRGDPGPRGSGR